MGGILYTTTRETLAKVTKNQEDFISSLPRKMVSFLPDLVSSSVLVHPTVPSQGFPKQSVDSAKSISALSSLPLNSQWTAPNQSLCCPVYPKQSVDSSKSISVLSTVQFILNSQWTAPNQSLRCPVYP